MEHTRWSCESVVIAMDKKGVLTVRFINFIDVIHKYRTSLLQGFFARMEMVCRKAYITLSGPSGCQR